jgi:ABC-type phosphate transport system substrate-binding protein
MKSLARRAREVEGMPGKLLIAMVAFALLLASPRAGADAAGGFKVIVHPAVKGDSITRGVLSQVYLGKVARWGNGVPITPIDLSAMSPVRGAFSEAMLGMPTTAVRRYWEQRLMAGGGRPPMVKTAVEDVIAAVAANDGAIGYVPEETPVPENVKVIAVQ